MTAPTEDRHTGHATRRPGGGGPGNRRFPSRIAAFMLLCAASLALAVGYAWWSAARRASFVRQVSLPPIGSLAELEAPAAEEGSTPPVGEVAAPPGVGSTQTTGLGPAAPEGSGPAPLTGAGSAPPEGAGSARGGGFRPPVRSTRRPDDPEPVDHPAAGRPVRSRWTVLASVGFLSDSECGRPRAGTGRRHARGGRPDGAGRR